LSDYTFAWTETEHNITAQANIASYLGTKESLTGLNLVLNPGLLTDGRTYAFRLSVTDSRTGLTGTSIALVLVTAGPVVQSFTAEILGRDTGLPETPSRNSGGVEHTDVYQLATSAYLSTGSDALSYRYGFMSADGSSESVLTEDQISPVSNGKFQLVYQQCNVDECGCLCRSFC